MNAPVHRVCSAAPVFSASILIRVLVPLDIPGSTVRRISMNVLPTHVSSVAPVSTRSTASFVIVRRVLRARSVRLMPVPPLRVKMVVHAHRRIKPPTEVVFSALVLRAISVRCVKPLFRVRVAFPFFSLSFLLLFSFLVLSFLLVLSLPISLCSFGRSPSIVFLSLGPPPYSSSVLNHNKKKRNRHAVRILLLLLMISR
jgi:hypothetical protein